MMTELVRRIQSIRKDIFKPLPRLSLDEWADTYRYLSQESSSEPGRWYTTRTEYLREIMKEVCDTSRSERVCVQAASQLGKSEILLNAIGFYVHQDPSPILLVQPTIEAAQMFSKERIAPMIRDTPVLTDRVAEPKSRDGTNTIRQKVFPGGILAMVGANAPSGLAMRPIRIVLFDEVDRYNESAGTEGNPIELAIKRTSTFRGRRKIIMVSSPGLKDTSQIESWYNNSTMDRYYIECTSCGEYFTPIWVNIIFDRTEEGEYDPTTARMQCPHCQALLTEGDRDVGVRNGKWISAHPNREVRGFHLNALISPWVSFSELVTEWLGAQHNREKLKTFINTRLGETFDDSGESVDNTELMSRREPYDEDILPNPIQLLTAGVDVQVDRIEVEVVGWGVDDENWDIDYQIFHGDPLTPALWQTLKDYLLRAFTREDGLIMKIEGAGIDTGYATQHAYEFCEQNKTRRWYPLKGQPYTRVIFPRRPSRTDKGKVYMIGVDVLKDTLYGWLQIITPGPGYCHFPYTRDATYFEQLTSEKKVTRYKRGSGFPVRVWSLPKGRHNEALDCRIYAAAAKHGLGTTIPAMAKRNEKLLQKQQVVAQKQTEPDQSIDDIVSINTKVKKTRPRGGWISGMMR